MIYRVKNENGTDQSLHLTRESWYGILDLAEDFGWNPMGALWAGEDDGYGLPAAGTHLGVSLYWNGGTEDRRLVIFEDALNLADALERAFIDIEPRRLPASYFYFEPQEGTMPASPSLGALMAVIEICRRGAFWIEPGSKVIQTPRT